MLNFNFLTKWFASDATTTKYTGEYVYYVKHIFGTRDEETEFFSTWDDAGKYLEEVYNAYLKDNKLVNLNIDYKLQKGFISHELHGILYQVVSRRVKR